MWRCRASPGTATVTHPAGAAHPATRRPSPRLDGTGLRDTEREYLDLADIIHQALNPREPEAAARGLAVSASITSTPVAGDARLLARLAANLIDNAIRHNKPGGQIGVQVTTSDGHAQLKITNSGQVIPAGQVPGLLQPFQTARQPDRPRGEPRMGLPIIAAIAKAHHARLTISPGRLGGLDIDVTFPRLHPGKTANGTRPGLTTSSPAVTRPPDIAGTKPHTTAATLEHPPS